MIRWLHSLLLRWHIWEAECHLRGCKQDGRVSSYAVGSLQAQIDAYRVRLMLLARPVGVSGSRKP